MAAGDFFTSYHDFNLSTQAVVFYGPEDVFNEATKHTYLLQTMLEDLDIQRMVRGGSKIKHQVQTGDSVDYGPYDPGQEESPSAGDNLAELETGWAMNRARYVYDEEEQAYNDGDEKKWKSLKKLKESELLVGTLNGIESQLCALPDDRTMELRSTKPYAPYSILCFVTRDGLEPSTTNGGIATGSSAWTTLLGKDPGTNSWWQNQYLTYSLTSPDDQYTGLIGQFRRMAERVKYQIPTKLKPIMRDQTDDRKKQVILTNEDGVVYYNARLRAANDQMRVISDGDIGQETWRGIPIQYVSELDNAGWTANQPDFLFLNLKFLFPVIREGWFMKKKLTDGGTKQPNRHTQWSFTHHQLTCESRRRQGRLYGA